VFLDEFLIGSLSIVGASHEHAIVRAFGSEDATGPVVKANDLINISNLNDCTTLLFTLCDLAGPITSNSLGNIVVDPDLTDGGDGDYDNVGTVADDGLYHVYGDINQAASGYGRFKVVYTTDAIQSIAVSFFPTSTANANPFTDTAYTDQWISTIVAPHSFTPESPTAITLNKKTVTVQNTGLIVLGLALITLAALSVVVVRRQSIAEQNAGKH
jgi:hypothetical protein